MFDTNGQGETLDSDSHLNAFLVIVLTSSERDVKLKEIVSVTWGTPPGTQAPPWELVP